MPIRHPTKALQSQPSRQITYIYIYISRVQLQEDSRYIVYSRMWRPGCFPGAWRRGSWQCQVASLHLQCINHGPLSASHSISMFPSWASVTGGECRPRSEVSRTYIQGSPSGCVWREIPGVTQVEKGHVDNTVVTVYVGGNMEHGLLYRSKKLVPGSSRQELLSCWVLLFTLNIVILVQQ